MQLVFKLIPEWRSSVIELKFINRIEWTKQIHIINYINQKFFRLQVSLLQKSKEKKLKSSILQIILFTKVLFVQPRQLHSDEHLLFTRLQLQ